MGKRLHFLDADFRKEPKTRWFCAICQRDVKHGYRKAWMEDDGLGQHLVHKDDLDGSEFQVLIGSACAKKVPEVFLIYQLIGN